MTESVTIPAIKKNYFDITIVGKSPLISHRFADSQKQDMLARQMKRAAKPREAKDPERDFEESIYRTKDGRPGFPASGIKKACVEACRYLDITMTWAKGAFYILGDIIPINGEPQMREDVVRLNGKTADIRYRAEYPEWSMTFRVLHNPDIITPEGIVNLIENAGFYVGIGDWRPQKLGIYGMFEVDK